MPQTFSFPVGGMSCTSCAARIEKILNRLDSVEASVNFASEQAQVTVPQISASVVGAVVEAVRKAGFTVAESTVDFALSGMSCAACAARIEKVLNRQAGVQASVNFASERAHITYVPGLVGPDALVAAIEKAGFGAQLLDETTQSDPSAARKAAWNAERNRFLLTCVLAAPLFIQMLGMLCGFHEIFPRWLQFACATPVQFYCARHLYQRAWNALRGGSANMDVLVVLGTSIAYGFSTVIFALNLHQPVYFEASVAIITLISLGKLMEARAKERTSAGLESLLRLQPQTAHVESEGGVTDKPVAHMASGDIFVVRPGESVPVDGVVLDGRSEINEAMLTGESLPILKGHDDQVFAGTINTNGMVRVRATGVGSETALARIVALVARAQGSKASVQKLADRVSAIFVPGVIAFALLTFLAGWLITGSATWALVSAVSVLVIACPCSLGLATPTAIMVGTGLGARSGILFRNADAIEKAQKLTTIILDKTGTLTMGAPTVCDIIPAHEISTQRLMGTAFSLEQNSEHPLARAIVSAAQTIGVEHQALEGFEAIPGMGVSGTRGGAVCRLGSPRFIGADGVSLDDALVSRLENDGKTVIAISEGETLLGYIALADQLRPDAVCTVAALKVMGLKVVMLTGDNHRAASVVARRVRVDDFLAGVLPSQKAESVEAYRTAGDCVGMVGDGINDAPALAAADVGFAIGAGSDVALETADIVLMRSELTAILDAISLSRATLAKIRQNLFFAFFYNLLGLPLAALGLLNPIIAGAAMAMSSVSVVSNSLLLNRWKPLERHQGS